MLPLSGPLGSRRILNSSKIRKTERALRLGNTHHVYETLEERRNRAQLMDTYKYLNNYYITPPERVFKKNGERTRGDSQKLFKKRARLE